MGVNYTTLDIISEDGGEYYIKMTVQDIKTRFIWDLIVIYGDAQQDKKARFLSELSRVLHGCINPVLIGETLISLEKLLKK